MSITAFLKHLEQRWVAVTFAEAGESAMALALLAADAIPTATPPLASPAHRLALQ